MSDTAAVQVEWSEIWRAMANAYDTMAKVNIVLCGRTGVGKSTLLNAMFGQALAFVDVGEPVTQEAEWYAPAGHPLRILDTKGLEMEVGKPEALEALKEAVLDGRTNASADKRIHLAWICVDEFGARWEKAHEQLLDFFNSLTIPAIVVLTKSEDPDEKFKKEVERLVPNGTPVVPVMAEEKRIRGGSLPAFGLQDLVTASCRLLPEAVRTSFVAVQRVDMKQKEAEALKWIHIYAASWTATLAVPSWGIHAALAQAGVLGSVSAIFGVSGEAFDPSAPKMIGGVVQGIAGLAAYSAVPTFVIAAPLFLLVKAALDFAGLECWGRSYVNFLMNYHAKHGVLPSRDAIVEWYNG